jgi:hypothetical protein
VSGNVDAMLHERVVCWRDIIRQAVLECRVSCMSRSFLFLSAIWVLTGDTSPVRMACMTLPRRMLIITTFQVIASINDPLLSFRGVLPVPSYPDSQQGRQCSIVLMSTAAVESWHLRLVCVWRCAGAAHHPRLPLAITVARRRHVLATRGYRVCYCTCLSPALSSGMECGSGRLLNALTERAGRKWVRALNIIVAGALRGRGTFLGVDQTKKTSYFPSRSG